MQSVANDTIGGFNKFLEDQQKAPGTATITLHQFDDHFETPIPTTDIKKAQKLDGTTFVPRGSTALLDAIGEAVKLTGDRLKNMPEADRAGKVVFVIITDGLENASHKFSRLQVFDMIKHQRDVYKWQFVFLGADQDSFAEASKLGVSTANAMSFSKCAAGVMSSYDSASFNLRQFRSGSKKDMSFEAGDYAAQDAAGAKNNPPPTTP